MENRTFHITIARDDGEQGAWEVPERLFESFRLFMSALQSGHSDVKYYGDHALGSNSVQPRLIHTGQKKIAAIKLLRQFYGWGLIEAKTKADMAPTLLPVLSYAKAEALRMAFIDDNCGEIELPNALERIAKAL